MNSFPDDLQPALQAYEAGRLDDAENICREKLKAAPTGELFFLLGLIANKSGRHAESVQWLERAATAMPPSFRLFSALGGAYRANKEWPKAAECFGRCLQMDSGSHAARVALANVCYDLGEYGLAAKFFGGALAAQPENPWLWNNYANALRNLGQAPEALAAHARAFALGPDEPLIRANYGVALLQQGRLAEGFRGYEARWLVLKLRTFAPPVWRGEYLPDKTLFLFAEQGMGDMIQFARFVKLARGRVGRVVLECHPPLKRLFENSRLAETLVGVGETIPPFDVYLPLMHLPSIFATTLETIPATVPYLASPEMAGLPEKSGRRLRVGLVWSGNPAHNSDTTRSIALEQFSPLFQIAGAEFFSLQFNVPPRDENYFSTAPLVRWMSGAQDMADTAARAQALDLIISVDTAVAHLAGALGKPVWTLLGWPTDWRWMLERRDSPWYPTMRLFRRQKNSDWPAVIADVAAALRELISSK